METLQGRFLRYVAIDTQSDERSETTPSTGKQLLLLGLLRDELQAMGIAATMDERGYVTARIPSNCPEQHIPAIGFIAHADTSPDAPGKEVKPQIIENYDGGDIALKGAPGLFLKP
ncbi:MAG: peptidase T, partial [Bacteroidales bacterium]|nr:peptidase T [Bacteroidales bacterium]